MPEPLKINADKLESLFPADSRGPEYGVWYVFVGCTLLCFAREGQVGELWAQLAEQIGNDTDKQVIAARRLREGLLKSSPLVGFPRVSWLDFFRCRLRAVIQRLAIRCLSFEDLSWQGLPFTGLSSTSVIRRHFICSLSLRAQTQLLSNKRLPESKLITLVNQWPIFPSCISQRTYTKSRRNLGD